MFRTRRHLLCVVAITIAISGSLVRAADLDVFPTDIVINDEFDRRQLVVTSAGRDVTHAANFSIRGDAIVEIDSTGYLSPIADGRAEIVVQHDGQEKVIEIQVGRQQRHVDFAREIVPILSRLGCNSGGCHGKQGGQNGFQLSLFGFDQEFDHDAIVKLARGRRLSLASAKNSLLLMKATGEMPHGGGQRMNSADESYQLIRRWIENGAGPASADAPQVVKLSIYPRLQVLSRDGAQQVSVHAEFSDGTIRDVTRQAEFQSNMTNVAIVDKNGLVETLSESGEATVMARYMGHVGIFNAIVPHGEPLDEIPGFKPSNYVDQLAAEKWKKLGLQPSPLSDDATFLRRVTVDVCGRLPSAEETRAFLNDNSPDKRAIKIDQLLESPDYPAFFAMRWGVILRNSKLAGADQATYAFHNWLKDQIAQNRPY
ncbi:MAG: hypothetical protein ACI9HK_006239, partial [Pirellulaceae bacterium]